MIDLSPTLEKVPCIDLSHLTEEQKRSYLIADNKLALNGGWNEDLLRMELTDLKELGANLELTGFDAMELADVWRAIGAWVGRCVGAKTAGSSS